MVTVLTRKTFPDRTINPEELQGILLMLSDWARQAGENYEITLTLNFWGFPTQQGANFAEAVAAGIRALGIGPLTTRLTDPNTLTVEGTHFTSETSIDATNAGRLLALVADPWFENLWCELRLGYGDKQIERVLALYGVVQTQHFVLKAVYPQGAGKFQEKTYGQAPWPNEAAFLNSLREYWNGNRTLPPWARAEIFASAEMRATGKGLVWFLQPSQAGFAPFLLRAGLATAVFALSISILLLVGLSPGEPSHAAANMPLLHGLRLFGITGLVLSMYGIWFTVGQKSRSIFRLRKSMRSNLQKVFTQPIRYLATDLSATPRAVQDPALLKFTQELLDLGGQHIQDIAIDPPTEAHAFIRIFQFPDDGIVLSLLLMHMGPNLRFFPAKPIFQLRTYLSDGRRVDTVNDGLGWRKPLLKHVITRIQTGVTDPGALLAAHRETVRKIGGEGMTPLVIAPEQIIPRIEEDHAENNAALTAYGYFRVADAFRMAFKMPRREYQA